MWRVGGARDDSGYGVYAFTSDLMNNRVKSFFPKSRLTTRSLTLQSHASPRSGLNIGHSYKFELATFFCAGVLSARLRALTFDSITRTLNSTPCEAMRCCSA